MMKNIVLTGFMGTGKTAVARELSSLTGMKIIDMDSEIEREQGVTINEIFTEYGEERFREIETEMAKKVSDQNGVVISTGGGVVLRGENIDHLRRNGLVVCLTASANVILERTGRSNERPLLNVEDPISKIKGMLEYRMPFYRNADIMIDTDEKTPRQVAEEIVEALKWKK
jgi:shikimate kinase